MKTAAAYIRVSTDDQVELSPDSQKEEILAYAHRNDIVLPEEYVFIEGERKKGLSGRKAANRPRFQEMIALAKEDPRPFDCILLWKFSRFARNIDEATYYKSILRNKCGIDVISISEPIMEGMYGRLIEMIIEWSDEFYSFNLATEVKRGMKAKANAGEFCSHAPIGYKMADKKLVIDPATADAVRNIFESYAEGERVRDIVIRLNGAGVRTRYGNMIDSRFVIYVISNPVYKGDIVFSTDGKRGRGTGYGGDNIINRRGIHEPIVSEELWQRCNERYERERCAAHRESRKNDYALRSLLKCGRCGSALSYASHGRLQCCSYNRGVCTESHSISCETAERAIIERLRVDLADITYVTAGGRRKSEKTSDAAIANLERRLSRLDDAYLAGAYSPEEYSELRKRITEASEREAEKHECELAPAQESAASTKSIIQGLCELSPRLRNQALMSIIERVNVHKRNGGYELEIIYK